MNPKKITVKLRLLLGEITEYYRGSCLGVPAMDPDVLRLWTDYNEILVMLKVHDPDYFSAFDEIPYPAPSLADSESLYKEGSMIYTPEHFGPLRTAVGRLLRLTVPLTWSRESA